MAKNLIDIIYEDNEIFVINKPAGISVTHDRSGSDDIIEVLQKQIDLGDLRIVHRLDKDTSGVMILAKHKDAQSKFCSLFEKSNVKKTYLALVTGCPESQTGEIDTPIMQSEKDPRKMEVNSKKGKDAKTRWQLLADFGSIGLLAARPVTGRTHQIRVHFQHAGFPLVIDPLYGSNSPLMLSSFKAGYRFAKFAEEIPLITRLTLCAYELEVENLHLTAPLEKKFKAAIKMLTKYNPKGPAAFVNDQTFEQLLNAKPLLLDI
jgi:23S rRNA pseudouridine955/2504/2580 synthase/23S rRNA pseudouridine1911/1915/1917 synthase